MNDEDQEQYLSFYPNEKIYPLTQLNNLKFFTSLKLT